MNVKRLRDVLPGERLLAVEPPLQTELLDAPGRLNFYDGRSLSAGALEREQRHRAGRLSVAGRFLEPGIVAGLELDLVSPLPGAQPDYLEIAAGAALTMDGEDLVLGRSLRVALAEIPVYAPASLLVDPGAEEAPEMSGSWRFGPRFGDLVDPASLLPRVAVIVLRAVAAGMVGEGDANDPCALSPDDYAFEDWQWVDALQVVMHVWPTTELPLPARDALWRNRLADTVFNAEQALTDHAQLPWWALGVPLALVAFDDQWEPQFVDRFSVARLFSDSSSRSSRQLWSRTNMAGMMTTQEAAIRVLTARGPQHYQGRTKAVAGGLDECRSYAAVRPRRTHSHCFLAQKYALVEKRHDMYSETLAGLEHLHQVEEEHCVGGGHPKNRTLIRQWERIKGPVVRASYRHPQVHLGVAESGPYSDIQHEQATK